MPTDNSGGPVTTSQGAAAVGSLPGNTAMNSSEQIYSPVLIRSGGGGGTNLVPGFEPPVTGDGGQGRFGSGSLNPTARELSPYFSNILGGSWIQQCDFQIAYNNGIGANGADVNLRKVNRTGVTQVLVNQLRGPLVLSGWGFDHGDRAAPNSGSDAFEHDQGTANDRSKWKAGPVDLKWDEVWKVWGAGHHMVCGVVQGGIAAPDTPCVPTTFTMNVFRNTTPQALPVDLQCRSEQVLVKNRDPSLSQEPVEGQIFCVAARINYEYIPVWVGCPEPPSPGETPPPNTCC